jgi:hypothetical protein
MIKGKYLITVLSILTGCAATKIIPTQIYDFQVEVGESGLGTAMIVNSEGQTVRTLFKNAALLKGVADLKWDGLSDDGKLVEGNRGQLIVSVSSWNLSLMDNFGGLGSTPGRFLTPQALCAAYQGSRLTVAVADTGNNRIQLLTDSGGFLQEIGQFGLGDQRLNQPSDVDWDGLIITVCDSQNQRLARFDSTGAYLGEIRQLSGFQTTPSHPVNLDFQNPSRLQRDGGSFWVSDTGYSILDLVTTSGGLMQQLGTDVPLGNIGPFVKWPDGDIWIQTGKNQVRIISSNGNDQGSLKVSPPFQAIGDLAFNPLGFAVVSDSAQDLIYFLDSKGNCFAALTPEKCAEPSGLSIMDNQIFVIDQDQNKIFNYKLIAEKPLEYSQVITLKTQPSLSSP